MQVLITSPIPSHPQNHGNRARVFNLCKTLQKRGYEIHFVYGGLEGLSHEQEDAMRNDWDHVYIARPPWKKRPKSKRNHYLIDDWYFDTITKITNRILSIWKIDVCLANYVWFSGWLDHVPAGIPKLIDTHDIFSDRDQALKKQGIDASWFSTTRAEENKGFKRADKVIAIQKEEALELADITDVPIDVIGHVTDNLFLPPKPASSPIAVGYMASDNPINRHSLKALVQELTKRPDLTDKIRFFLAGPICKSAEAENTPFHKLGFVPDAADFFRDMDLVINPNIGGTGLKIKSIDAMAYGRPLLSTADGMAGIHAEHKAHQAADMKAFVDLLMHFAETPDKLNNLGAATRDAFLRYETEQEHTLDRLFPIQNKVENVQ